jgi:hypothetical protein
MGANRYELTWEGEDGKQYSQVILSERKWTDAELRALVMAKAPKAEAEAEAEAEVTFVLEAD